MAIRDWPTDERPREKLLERGAAALSDAELWRFCCARHRGRIRTRSRARAFSSASGRCARLIAADRGRFCAGSRLGPVRFAELQAAAEISRRQLSRVMRAGPLLASPKATRDFLNARLRDLEHEVFCCMYLDKRHRLIQFEELFRGTIDGASVHPRGDRQARAAEECRRRHRRSQPSIGRGGTESGGRTHHAAGQGSPRAGRHPASRSHHRGRRRQRVAGGTWADVMAELLVL